MILIKGGRVSFKLDTGKTIARPASHGIIHDPEGHDLPKCVVFFGPYRRVRKADASEIPADAKHYFGREYQAKVVHLDRASLLAPASEWTEVRGRVVTVYYTRPGAHAASYFHHFKHTKEPLVLSKRGAFYRIDLPGGCVVNWRGFVWP